MDPDVEPEVTELVPKLVPNDPTDPRFGAFWDAVRELSCPTETFYGSDD